MDCKVNKNRLITIINKLKNKKIVFSMCAILSVFSIFVMILVFSRYDFHSDCMGYLLQAKEQVKQHKWFPQRFHYTTGIFGFSTSVYMMPFVNLIHNDYLLHEIGSIIALAVTVSLVWVLFWKKKHIASLITLLVCFPGSYTYNDMMFFQSAYINVCTVIMLNLVAFKYLYDSITLENYKSSSFFSRRIVFASILFFGVVYFTNYCGIQNYVYVVLPLLGAIVIVIWLKHGLDIKALFSERKYIFVILLMIIGVVAGKLTYDRIIVLVGFDTATNVQHGGIISLNEIHDLFWVLFPRFLADFGITSTTSLISLSTVRVILGFVYFFFTVIGSHVYMIRHAEEYDEYNKVLIYFSALLNGAVLFIVFLGGEREDRYYFPAMFGAQINNALLIENVTKRYKKQFGYSLYLVVIFMVLSMHVDCYKAYINRDGADFSIQNMVNPKVESELVNVLEEHDLQYGFATFWRAYSHMVASNSKIEIAAYDMGNPLMPYFFDGNNPEHPKYYACSEDLYNPELHPGRCFVLVADGEVIPDKFYQFCNEQYVINGFTILVYDKNIHYIDELVE